MQLIKKNIIQIVTARFHDNKSDTLSGESTMNSGIGNDSPLRTKRWFEVNNCTERENNTSDYLAIASMPARNFGWNEYQSWENFLSPGMQFERFIGASPPPVMM